MNSNQSPEKKSSSTPSYTAQPSHSGSGGGLNLTPEQAKRETDKLRDGREQLENSRDTDDTSVRSSPLGRHDE